MSISQILIAWALYAGLKSIADALILRDNPPIPPDPSKSSTSMFDKFPEAIKLMGVKKVSSMAEIIKKEEPVDEFLKQNGN